MLAMNCFTGTTKLEIHYCYIV